MASIEIIWEGLTEMVADLQAYGERSQENIKQAMTESGQVAKDAMDENTPVRTGKLKGGNTLTETADGFELSNDVEYAKFVNYGTRHMAAEPFLEPAVEVATQQLEQNLPKAIEFTS